MVVRVHRQPCAIARRGLVPGHVGLSGSHEPASAHGRPRPGAPWNQRPVLVAGLVAGEEQPPLARSLLRSHLATSSPATPLGGPWACRRSVPQQHVVGFHLLRDCIWSSLGARIGFDQGSPPLSTMFDARRHEPRLQGGTIGILGVQAMEQALVGRMSMQAFPRSRGRWGVLVQNISWHRFIA